MGNYLRFSDNIMCAVGSNNNGVNQLRYFHQMIISEVLRPQEGDSRSQNGSPAAIAAQIDQIAQNHTKYFTFCSDMGPDSCYIGNRHFFH